MKYKIPLWKHQAEAIERAKDLSSFALFMEMGTGKTSTTINILRYKYNSHKRVLRTLILCPPIVISNWKKEWLMHSNITPNQICELTGSAKKRLVTFNDAKSSIFVTNYEALLMPEFYKALQEWDIEVLIMDEMHRVKNPKAKRSKLLDILANPKDGDPIPIIKLGLTGTPVLNSPLDLFMQYKILDGGKTFGNNFFVFRARYFEDKNVRMPRDRYFPNWVIKKTSLNEINSKVALTAAIAKKSDCLDLPPFVNEVIEVELGKEQRKHYDEMFKDFITFIESSPGEQKAVVATLAITKALRLQQIVSGFAKTSTGEIIRFEDNPRRDALKELLEDLTPSHKVLVWCTFKEDYETIRQVCNELKIEFVEVHGEISPARQRVSVDSFYNNASIRVFIGHPWSGGIGINLVSASYSIFYSRSFSLEHSLQAEARNFRGGSEIHSKITRIDITSKNTIDEKIQKVLALKEDVSEKVLMQIGKELANE